MRPARKERLTDHELASRISYFLWSTMPDETLLRLADQGKLRDPAVLAAQIRRMIQDPKAWPFIEQFAEQWLELDRLQRVAVSKNSYPGFDDQLAAGHAAGDDPLFRRGAARRPEHLPVPRLRLHVRQRNVWRHTTASPAFRGRKFRKVKLDESYHRGGLLTHASILTGNSDGRDGHPIKRGMWLLKNLLRRSAAAAAAECSASWTATIRR